MKGKRLYQLIKELTKTEHRQLVHACSVSSDKRTQALLALLKKRHLSEQSFEAWLESIFPVKTGKNPSEQDKKQRRWVDFACKEIENLLLRNFYTENEKRNHELSQLFDKRDNHDLTAYYNEKAIATARKNNWLDILISEYDTELRWLSRNQTSTHVERIGWVLNKRLAATQLRYHEAMSYFYTVSSALYIDNPVKIARITTIPGASGFNALKTSATDDYSKVLYSLAEARYNFYDRKKFELILQKCFQLLPDTNLSEKEKQVLKRSLLYVRITAGIFYGYPITAMRKDAQEMFELSVQNKFHDTTGFFLLLFFLLIEGEMQKHDEYLRTYKAKMFIKGTEDYLNFLQAFHYYLDGKNRQAVNLLLDTSYSNSMYIALWSRVLEISIHRKDGDLRLCQVLISRTKRFLKKNNHHNIVCEPVSAFLKVNELLLRKKSPPAALQGFAYYQRLV